MTQIFLYSAHSGSMQSFPDPGNWNPVHTIECIGCGGAGTAGLVGKTSVSGGGGGGGGYAVANNLTLTFPVQYFVPNGGIPTPGNYHSCFNYNSPNSPATAPPNAVSAQGGSDAVTSQAGVAGAKVYPTGYVGGTAGAGSISINAPGGGGAGAAGPHGVGGTGGNSTTTVFGGGGSADNNNTAAQPTAGGTGISGTQFDATHGCGGGGAGGPSTTVSGGNGGQYGGGGGGGYCNYPYGIGGDGLVVITYTPLIPPASSRAMIVA